MTLSNRIKQAAEGSPELDAEIAVGLRFPEYKYPDMVLNKRPKSWREAWERHTHDGGGYKGAAPPAFTTSLDAAMSLGDGLSEAELWCIWNEALSACSVKNLDLRHDVARFWAAAALKARGL